MWIYLVDLAVYSWFGAKGGSARSPMPPMTPIQNGLFLISGALSIVCVIWVFLIYFKEKYQDH